MSKINTGLIPIDFIKEQLKDVYSTNEIKTNKVWVNGKPIYRRCYNARITTQTANIDINNFVADVESIVSLTGGAKGNNYSYGFYWKDNSDHYLAILNQNTTNLNIQIGTSYPAVPFNATVIVEYTKTTD